MKLLRRVRGTEDLCDEDIRKQNFILKTAINTAKLFAGYQEISTPILEQTGVFERTLGDSTDILSKEMYTFKDKGGDSVSLRPEGTAGVIRHFITESKHHHLPLKLFYHGPMFRYERPQKGRLRQFTTFGVEMLGNAGSRADVECVSMAWLFIKKLGVEKDTTIYINNIGNLEERETYKAKLLKFLKPNKRKLSAISRKRLKLNPLRILDSKEPEDQEIILQAPPIEEGLSTDSQSKITPILNGLDALEIPWRKKITLFRGLDYYNHFVFEFCSDNPQLGAQNTVLAGGHYDTLVRLMSREDDDADEEDFKDIPAIGWGAGIERLRLLITEDKKEDRPIALIPLGEQAEKTALKLAWSLRKNHFPIFHPAPKNNLGKKMKRALNVNSRIAIIFGPEELKNHNFSVKDLDKEEQKTVPKDELFDHLKKLCRTKD